MYKFGLTKVSFYGMGRLQARKKKKQEKKNRNSTKTKKIEKQEYGYNK